MRWQGAKRTDWRNTTCALGAILALLRWGPGCLGPDTSRCSWGVICPPGKVCHDERRQCVLPEQIAACQGLIDFQPCEFLGAPPGSHVCRDGVCVLRTCGDGELGAGEECDGEQFMEPFCARLEGKGFQAGAVGCRSDECTYDLTPCWKGGWQPMDTGTVVDLMSVHGSQTGLVLATGRMGTVLVFNRQEGRWEPLEGFRTECDLPSAEPLNGIFVSAAGDRFLTVGNKCIAAMAWIEEFVVTHCRVDLVCEGSPNRLHEVWALPDLSRAWTVGVPGRVLVYDDAGGTWREETLPLNETYDSVSGRSADEVYIASNDGSVMQWDGQQWLSLDQNLADDGLGAVWAPHDSTDLYVAGWTVLHYDGSTWTDLDPQRLWTGGESWRDICGTGSREFWLVGSDGMVGQFDGIHWRLERAGGEELRSVFAGGPFNEVYAAGWSGVVFRYQGRYWTDVAWEGEIGLKAVSLLPDGDVVAVGTGGTFIRFDGLDFNPMDTEGEVQADLTAVWAGEQTAVAVGTSGTVAKLVGDRWTPAQLDPDVDFMAVSGVEIPGSVTVVAVGTDGAAWWFDGTDWSADSTLDATAVLFGVWVGTGFDGGGVEVYAVGEAGTILHHHQGAWERMPPPADADLRDLFAVAADESRVVAVGDTGTIWELDRSAGQWEPAASFPTSLSLYSVWTPPSGVEFFAVGQENTVVYFDGRRWSPMEPAPICKNGVRTMWGIAGGSRHNVFAVGDRGCVFRFTGRMNPPAPPGP